MYTDNKHVHEHVQTKTQIALFNYLFVLYIFYEYIFNTTVRAKIQHIIEHVCL